MFDFYDCGGNDSNTHENEYILSLTRRLYIYYKKQGRALWLYIFNINNNWYQNFANPEMF